MQTLTVRRLASVLWQPSNQCDALIGVSTIMILIAFFHPPMRARAREETRGEEVGRLLGCHRRIRSLVLQTCWTGPSPRAPPRSNRRSLPPAFTSPLWLYLTCCRPPGCTVLCAPPPLFVNTAAAVAAAGVRGTVQFSGFFLYKSRLHSDAFQSHETFFWQFLLPVGITVENWRLWRHHETCREAEE